MARRSKNLAARPNADADLPHFEDVFERENWESRMVKARKARKNVLTHLDDIGPGKSKGRAKKEAVANETEEPAVSLKKVMGTRNLKERLELAQKRHAQVQRKNRSDVPSSGFVYSQKSTDEFKKVVLNAKAVEPKSVPPSAKSQPDDRPVIRKTLPPLAQDSGAQQDEEPKKRGFLVFGLLGSGIAAMVVAAVLIGGLPEQTAVVENTSVAAVPTQLPSLPISLDRSYQPTALTIPAESTNPLSGTAHSLVAKTSTPESIGYLGGAEAAPQAVGPLPVQAGAVQVTWEIGSDFAHGPAADQHALVLTVAEFVRPSLVKSPGVALNVPVVRPGALTLPLVYSPVSLSLNAPDSVSPLIAEKLNLSGVYGGPLVDRPPNAPAVGVLLASLDPSWNLQTDMAPAVDTTAPVAAAAPEELIGAGLPAHNIRVFAPTNLSEDVSGDVVARLTQAGFDVGSLKSVGFRISSNNVRYYHRSDAEVAIALADMISANARDFTSFSPRPPLGTVELWLKGVAPTTVRRQTAQPRNSSNDPALQALRDRLAQRLRSGDHLGGG